MRIDGIGIQTAGAQNAKSASSVSFETGDVFIADVQRSEGDAVILKLPDGRLLNARLSENAVLDRNDRVEFIVAQSGENGLVLRIAYVEPKSAEAVPQEAFSAAEAALLELFEQSGIRPDARALASALRLMQQNGLTPKAALFFALNRMEATPERLAAYQALTSGYGMGEALYDAAQTLNTLLREMPDAAQTQALSPVQAQAQAPAQEQIQTQVPIQDQTQTQAPAQLQPQTLSPVQDQMQPQARATWQNGAEAPAGEANASGAQNGQAAVPPDGAQSTAGDENALAQSAQATTQPASAKQNTAAVRPGAPNGGGQAARKGGVTAPAQAAPQAEAERVQAQTVPPEETAKTAQTAPRGETAIAAQAAATGGTPPDAAELKELPKRMLDLFLRLTGSESGADVKKFVSGSNERLAALKFMTGKYDEESIRLVQPELTRAENQAKLAQDVTRFVYYQIPVYNGEYGTAELYVYRRAKGKGKIDADNASVLISIPTKSFGRVETLLRTESRTLSVNFSVERESGINALKEGVREFRKTLAAKTEYHLGEMRVGGLKERTTVENAEAILSGGAKRGGAIDVKI